MAIFKMDLNKIKEEKKRLEAKNAKNGKQFVFVPRYYMTGNRANLRILPPWSERGDICTTLYQHWNVSDVFKGPITCTKHTKDYGHTGECEICDLIDRLKETKRADCLELVNGDKGIRAQVTYLYNILDLDNPKWTQKDYDAYVTKNQRQDGGVVEVPFEIGEPKVQVFAAKTTVHQGIINLIDTNELNIADLDTGYDLVITKTGSGKNGTKYEVQPKLKSSKCPLVNEDNYKPNKLDEINPPLPLEKLNELLGAGLQPAVDELLGSGSVVKAPNRLLAASKAAAKAADDVDEAEALADAKADARKASRKVRDDDDSDDGALFSDDDDLSMEDIEAELRRKTGMK